MLVCRTHVCVCVCDLSVYMRSDNWWNSLRTAVGWEKVAWCLVQKAEREEELDIIRRAKRSGGKWNDIRRGDEEDIKKEDRGETVDTNPKDEKGREVTANSLHFSNISHSHKKAEYWLSTVFLYYTQIFFFLQKGEIIFDLFFESDFNSKKK